MQEIQNQQVRQRWQKEGNDKATVLISAFCNTLHSNDSSPAKVMLFCE